jgi:hypothetical protein
MYGCGMFQRGRHIGIKGLIVHWQGILKGGEVINPDTELTFHEMYNDVRAEWEVVHRVQPRDIYERGK